MRKWTAAIKSRELGKATDDELGLLSPLGLLLWVFISQMPSDPWIHGRQSSRPSANAVSTSGSPALTAPADSDHPAHATFSRCTKPEPTTQKMPLQGPTTSEPAASPR